MDWMVVITLRRDGLPGKVIALNATTVNL